ncbi:MAG: TlpA disulfide reductase family protein, partial [Pseudomonadota bacterium]|nr:TlpA disulfide reductase family protein [Pseudomonadota bacterium]
HLDEDKFAMVSISYKDTRPLLEEFVKEVKVDFPILLDSDGEVSKQWNIFAFPSSFLVDANGMIRYSLNAGSIWDSPEMLDYLKEVMAIPHQPTESLK